MYYYFMDQKKTPTGFVIHVYHKNKLIAYNLKKKKHEGYHLNVPAITNMDVLFRCKNDCIVSNKGKLKSHVLI